MPWGFARGLIEALVGAAASYFNQIFLSLISRYMLSSGCVVQSDAHILTRAMSKAKFALRPRC